MRAAKYLFVAYVAGALVTFGWLALGTLDAAGCLGFVKSCIAALQALAQPGLNWPYIWAYQLSGANLKPFRVPAGLIPIGVFICVALMVAFDRWKFKRKQDANEKETDRIVGNVRQSNQLPPDFGESVDLQWFRDPGGRRDQSLEPRDV